MEDDLKSAAESLKDLPSERKYKPQPAKRYHSKKPLLFLLILLVLLAAGYALKKYVLDKRHSTPAVVTSDVTKNSEKLTVTDVPDTTALEDYKSTSLGLSFKYPKTWTISELTGGVRVESPDFTYTAEQSGEVTGNFRIYIRKGSREVDGTYIGRGVAIKDSEKLVYSQPAAGQRTETLLSSFGYDSSDIFSFFLIAGNFQLAKGNTLGPNYGKEPDTYIVVGGYSSKGLTDDLSMNSMNVATYMNTRAYKQGYAIIQSLQLK